MYVMEYTVRFNELSRFTMHQVNTEERKMDHFEQGLRGDVKSVIVGQTFANFQEMYQQAAKVARVLEENEKEAQTLNLERKRRENLRQNSQGRTEKRNRINYPSEKGKQPMSRPPNPCHYCRKSHDEICLYGEGRCYECREKGRKKNECPKLIDGQSGTPPPAGPPRPPTAPPRPPIPPTKGRPPVLGAAQRTRNSNKPQTGGRVYCLEAEEGGDEDPHAVISGMLLVNVAPVTVLFDAGATHSFVNPVTTARMACEFEDLDV